MTEQAAEYTAEPAAEPSRYTLLSNEPVADEPIPAQEEVKQVAPEPDEPEEQTEKRKRDAQERIRKLAAERKEALERAERAEAALAEKNAPKTDEPNPADFVGGEFNPEYRRALREYDKAQIAVDIRAELERDKLVTELESEKAIVKSKEAKFAESHPDYHEAVQTVFSVGAIQTGDGIADALVDMDNGLEIVYQIGKDPDLLEEFTRLSPMQKLIKIGALSVANQQQTVKPVRVSQAVKPITPVSGGSAALTGTAAIEAAERDMDYDRWRRLKKEHGLK